jgi:deoxycytidylate deaminase
MMMNMEQRKGRLKPVIRKALVDTSGRPFLTFSKKGRSGLSTPHTDTRVRSSTSAPPRYATPPRFPCVSRGRRRDAALSEAHLDEYFMVVADAISKRATCDRGRSGCVIAKDRQILVTGYVGSPQGLPHCDDVGHQIKNDP